MQRRMNSLLDSIMLIVYVSVVSGFKKVTLKCCLAAKKLWHHDLWLHLLRLLREQHWQEDAWKQRDGEYEVSYRREKHLLVLFGSSVFSWNARASSITMPQRWIPSNCRWVSYCTILNQLELPGVLYPTNLKQQSICCRASELCLAHNYSMLCSLAIGDRLLRHSQNSIWFVLSSNFSMLFEATRETTWFPKALSQWMPSVAVDGVGCCVVHRSSQLWIVEPNGLPIP